MATIGYAAVVAEVKEETPVVESKKEIREESVILKFMKNKIRTILCVVFPAVEFILWLLVSFCNIGDLSPILSFITIAIAFLFSFLFFSKNISNKILTFGLFFTCCADFCLTIINPMQQNLSMIFFSAVQICYFVLLLLNESKKLRQVHYIIRSVVCLVSIILPFIVLKSNVDFLSVVSVFYFANLILNTIFAFIDTKSNLLFALGLIFFICCDTLVGLSMGNGIYFNLNPNGILYKIITLDINLIWFFYIPAQTLIALHTSRSK